MSKYIISILLILFSLALSSKLQTKCIAYMGDCDATSYCCANLVCKDYRCNYKGNNLTFFFEYLENKKRLKKV